MTASLAPSATAACQRWVADIVVGLDLCPWAAAPFARDGVRWRESGGETFEETVAEVVFEARLLCDGISETTLLVLPPALSGPSFEELPEPAEVCDAVLDDDGTADEVQLVAFHPDFRYADSEPDDPANGTNQSPFPMVHLLRRADIQAVHADGAAVARRNARVLRDRARAGD